MSTNVKNRERERQRKRESKATGQRSSTRKERDRKNKGDISRWGTTWNFVAVVRKWEMLAANWVKMSDSGKKVNKNTYDINLHKTCNQEASGSFTLTKKVCYTCKVAFLLIRPIFFQDKLLGSTSYDTKVKGLHTTHPSTAWSQNEGTVPAQRWWNL